MLEQNLVGIRALLLDSQLAERAGLEDELHFEFRSALDLLAKLHAMPELVLAQGNGVLSDESRSLIKALSAVVSGISYTVSDRFSSAMGVSVGFNSEDGD